MSKDNFNTTETAWCPGCGDFNILDCLKSALNDLNIEPHKVLIVGGIGQAAKTPQYINTNAFCGLHGRALPPAVAAKIANKELTVIVNTGDGDSYGEGGNHFIHNIRRNVDITHFVHDNQIYGLTKGQASPTTASGHVTKVQSMGNFNMPLNPISLAISLGAGFVARAFSGDKEHLTLIMAEAIKHKGYSLVDIFQPCVSFNKVNTFQWYKKRIYKLDESYDYTDKVEAFKKSLEMDDKIPIGIIYKNEGTDYTNRISFLKNGKPLVYKDFNFEKAKTLIKDFK